MIPTAPAPVLRRPPFVVPVLRDDFPAAAALLAEGTAFAPDVMARLLVARAAARTLPDLLGAREVEGGPLLGAALLDRHRPVSGGRLFTRIGVAPAARGRRVASLLAARLRLLLPDPCPPLCVEVDADDPRSQSVARRWGGAEYQRSLELRLPLHHGARQAAALTATQAGVTIQQLGPHSPEPLWQEAFGVYATAALDLPDRAEAPPPSYEMFRAQVDHVPGVHLARRGGVPIGVTGAGPDGSDSWYVFFTGTLAPVRRSGVARALKTALHETASAHGVRFVTTSTLDVNTAMLALNTSLGYRVSGGVVRFEIQPRGTRPAARP